MIGLTAPVRGLPDHIATAMKSRLAVHTPQHGLAPGRVLMAGCGVPQVKAMAGLDGQKV